MIRILDILFTNFIGYVMPLLVILALAAVSAFWVWGARSSSGIVKWEAYGLAMIYGSLIKGYWVWWGQFRQIAIETGNTNRPDVAPVCALAVTLACLLGVQFLRAMWLPWFVIGLIALGIALFGW